MEASSLVTFFWAQKKVTRPPGRNPGALPARPTTPDGEAANQSETRSRRTSSSRPNGRSGPGAGTGMEQLSGHLVSLAQCMSTATTLARRWFSRSNLCRPSEAPVALPSSCPCRHSRAKAMGLVPCGADGVWRQRGCIRVRNVSTFGLQTPWHRWQGPEPELGVMTMKLFQQVRGHTAVPFARGWVAVACLASVLCLNNASAQNAGGAPGGPPQGPPNGPMNGPPHGPPPEALAAFKALTSGAACSFEGRRGAVSGTCFAPQQSLPLACRPKDAPRPPDRAAPGAKP